MRRAHWLTVGILLATGGCGSSDTAGPGSGNGTLSATVDGTHWTATLSVRADRTASDNGVAIAGSNNGGASTIGLGVAWIDHGVGAYPIGGLTPTNALVSQGASVWVANATGGSGTLTVTAIDATHVAGTFAFTAVAGGGGSGGPRQVTNGQFDIKF